MGRQKWTDDRFGERLRTERERRKWSQAQMATMLADRGVQPMHPTTIAKIEAGDRSVRINEAVEIADLFEMSLDTLVGRATANPGSDLALVLRDVIDTAMTLWEQQAGIREVFHDCFADLQALEFTDRDRLEQHVQMARLGIESATSALAQIASFPLPTSDFEVTLRPGHSFVAMVVNKPRQEEQE